MRWRLKTRFWGGVLAGLLLAFFISPGSATQDANSSPSRADVESWLGSFRMGPETVTFSWDDGLYLQVDLIKIPVDGNWHETFATFGVRQRAFWLPSRNAIGFQEQHNYTALAEEQGVSWQYEYRLAADSKQLLKIARNGGGKGKETVVRKYMRQMTKSVD